MRFWTIFRCEGYDRAYAPVWKRFFGSGQVLEERRETDGRHRGKNRLVLWVRDRGGWVYDSGGRFLPFGEAEAGPGDLLVWGCRVELPEQDVWRIRAVEPDFRGSSMGGGWRITAE